MKTNKEKNTAHDAKMQDQIRPKPPVYDFQALQAVIRGWITGNK
jgi:hypothetical protein